MEPVERYYAEISVAVNKMLDEAVKEDMEWHNVIIRTEINKAISKALEESTMLVSISIANEEISEEISEEEKKRKEEIYAAMKDYLKNVPLEDYIDESVYIYSLSDYMNRTTKPKNKVSNYLAVRARKVEEDIRQEVNKFIICTKNDIVNRSSKQKLEIEKRELKIRMLMRSYLNKY
jgi:hypothetical protein